MSCDEEGLEEWNGLEGDGYEVGGDSWNRSVDCVSEGDDAEADERRSGDDAGDFCGVDYETQRSAEENQRRPHSGLPKEDKDFEGSDEQEGQAGQFPRIIEGMAHASGDEGVGE